MASPWTGLIGDTVGAMPRRMRVHVLCPECRHRHTLQRLVVVDEVVHVICHRCECPFHTTAPWQAT